MKLSTTVSAVLIAFSLQHAGAQSIFGSLSGLSSDNVPGEEGRKLAATCGTQETLNLIMSENFDNATSVSDLAAEGWVNAQLLASNRYDSQNFTAFLGPFYNTSQFPYIPITTTINASIVTKELVLEFDFYEIDSWDGDNLKDGVDSLGLELIGDIDEKVDLGHFRYDFDEKSANDTTPYGVYWSMTSDPSYDVNLGFLPEWSDQKHSFYVTIPDTFFKISGEVIIKFTWNLQGEKDEKVGIDNFFLSECTGTPDPTAAPTPVPTPATPSPVFEAAPVVTEVVEVTEIPPEGGSVDVAGVVEITFVPKTFDVNTIVTVERSVPPAAEQEALSEQLEVFASGDILPYTIVIVASNPPNDVSVPMAIDVPDYLVQATGNNDAIEVFAKILDENGVSVFELLSGSIFIPASNQITVDVPGSAYTPASIDKSVTPNVFNGPYTVTLTLSPTPGEEALRRELRGLQADQCGDINIRCPLAGTCTIGRSFLIQNLCVAVANGEFSRYYSEVTTVVGEGILAATGGQVLTTNSFGETGEGYVAIKQTDAAGNFVASTEYRSITPTIAQGSQVVAGQKIGTAKTTILNLYLIPGVSSDSKQRIDPVACMTLAAPTPAPSDGVRYLTSFNEVESIQSFVAKTQVVENCDCVDCDEDQKCGGLWRGDAVGGNADEFESVYLVLSHCLHSLDWLESFIDGVDVKGMTIVSKCDKPVVGNPPSIPTSIVPASNVGRNDHTYAAWMASAAENEGMSRFLTEKAAVVFLKDDMSNGHQIGGRRTLKELLRITSKNDFACGIKPGFSKTEDGMPISISTYHEGETLNSFHMEDYSRGKNIYQDVGNDNAIEFSSPKYANLGEWSAAMGAQSIEEIAPVCYGGVFAVRGSRIANKGDMWAAMEASLSRGNNIEEGHFAERSWAHLLSKPLSIRETMAVVMHSDGLAKESESYTGALAHTLV